MDQKLIKCQIIMNGKRIEFKLLLQRFILRNPVFRTDRVLCIVEGEILRSSSDQAKGMVVNNEIPATGINPAGNIDHGYAVYAAAPVLCM